MSGCPRGLEHAEEVSKRKMIRPLKNGEVNECEGILRSLPRWFGIEEAIVDYVRAVAAMETYVAERSGSIQGFLTLNSRSAASSEIHVMAVREELHGKGIGWALVEYAEKVLQGRGTQFLQVKTLGPSRPNAEYERTRAFYSALGFHPLEENNLWGPVNPCLILVKHLPCSRRQAEPS